MKLENLSVKKFLRLITIGLLATSFLVLLCLFLVTKNLRVVLYGGLLTAVFLVWGGIFLHYFQKKLTLFTDSLCRTLDDMMDSAARPEMDYEAETLLARISHRLERLYNIMQKDRNTVAKEKADLQSLLSDISHQTKTPIANLKMLNETMLTRPISEEQRREFLQATGSQLDKLDFLIQAMVKTSRLEAGVITLEKKDALIEETLVYAINGILAPMEKKGIELTVDCPEGLTISHDSRWTSEALFNLLDNAVKYTPAGGSIHVSVQNWEMYWKIDVTDTGRGIPEQEQATIFKRFYREEAVHEVDGIGIGLYLAREIITMQGGYIEAGVIPKFAACATQGVPWFQERGLWQDNSYEPRPGDIIFFDWDDGGQDGESDHVGIVEKVENGRVYTVEGNSGDSVRQNSYPIGYYEIYGYGTPAY